MICLEFRRRCTTDPYRLEPECEEHARQCAACASFAERSREFEQHLHDAMSVGVPEGLVARVAHRLDADPESSAEKSFEQDVANAVHVQVPEGLAGRILLRHAFDQRLTRRRRLLTTLALAASLTAVVGLSTLVEAPSRKTPFSEELIAHIENEPDALLTRAEVQEFRLTATLANLGMRLDGDIGRVTFAGMCEIGPVLGAHLVIAGERGPVTVIILPNKFIEQPRSFGSDNYRGILIPAARGSIAVVAEYPEVVDPVALRVDRALR